MPCRHGNSDRALDPGVSGLVCAEFSRNCLFRQNAAAQFSHIQVASPRSSHSPLDSMAGFYHWSPPFPAADCQAAWSTVPHVESFTQNRRHLEAMVAHRLAFPMATIYPGFFFSARARKHTWSKDIISHLPRIRPARPWRGLSQNFLIGTHGNNGKSPGNRHSTSPHRRREHQTCRLFSARPSTGAPSAMWLASAPHRRQSALELVLRRTTPRRGQASGLQASGQPLVWP